MNGFPHDKDDKRDWRVWRGNWNKNVIRSIVMLLDQKYYVTKHPIGLRSIFHRIMHHSIRSSSSCHCIGRHSIGQCILVSLDRTSLICS